VIGRNIRIVSIKILQTVNFAQTVAVNSRIHHYQKKVSPYGQLSYYPSVLLQLVGLAMHIRIFSQTKRIIQILTEKQMILSN